MAVLQERGERKPGELEQAEAGGIANLRQIVLLQFERGELRQADASGAEEEQVDAEQQVSGKPAWWRSSGRVEQRACGAGRSRWPAASNHHSDQLWWSEASARRRAFGAAIRPADQDGSERSKEPASEPAGRPAANARSSAAKQQPVGGEQRPGTGRPASSERAEQRGEAET